jgi:hypothetical protein
MSILQQNPRIFTTGTCALPHILFNTLNETRKDGVFMAMKTQQADSALHGLVHGATQGWFSGLTDKPVVISKNRIWNDLFHLYPDAKYICLLRDLRDIVDSFEKLNHKLKSVSALDRYSSRFIKSMSYSEKYNYYFGKGGTINVAVENVRYLMELKESQKYSNRIMFIRYEPFLLNPTAELGKIYRFLEEDNFDHDLNNISPPELYEHDNVYHAERTDHEIYSRIIPFEEKESKKERNLPTGFYDKIVEDYDWFYQRFYRAIFSLKEQKKVNNKLNAHEGIYVYSDNDKGSVRPT